MDSWVIPMPDTHRCRDCEALITQEWDLCEDCHSQWINWQMQMDAMRARLAAAELDPADSYWETT